MNISKVIVNGKTYLDLSNDDIGVNEVLDGFKAHNKYGIVNSSGLSSSTNSSSEQYLSPIFVI